MKCGILGDNCTYSFQWYWCKSEYIHLYPEHIHLHLCVNNHVVYHQLMIIQWISHGTYMYMYIYTYPHKNYGLKKFGIQSSNCTHSFQWYWCKSEYIHLYPEHIHLHLCVNNHVVYHQLMIIQWISHGTYMYMYIYTYPHKNYGLKKFGIQSSNCTHSFQWYWCKSEYIHLYPEHIHLHLCVNNHVVYHQLMIIQWISHGTYMYMYIYTYPHKNYGLKKFGIQSSNCTHSFQWYWCKSEYIHLYPEHIHLHLCVKNHVVYHQLMIIQWISHGTYMYMYIYTYPHKNYGLKKFGIQSSNCTHSFQWYWCKSEYIHLYPEHIHLHLCVNNHVV